MKLCTILAVSGLFVVGTIKPSSKSLSTSDFDVESCSTTSESIEDHIEQPQLGATAQLIANGRRLAAQQDANNDETETVGISLMKKSEEKQRLISELTTRIEIITGKIAKVTTAIESTFDELAKTQENVSYYEGVLHRLKAQLQLWKNDGTIIIRGDNDDEPEALSADQANRLTGIEVAAILEPGVQRKEKVMAEINGELAMLSQQHAVLCVQRANAERELAAAQETQQNHIRSGKDVDGAILNLAEAHPDAMAPESVEAIKQRNVEEARRELARMRNKKPVEPQKSTHCLLL